MTMLFLVVDIPESLSPPERWTRLVKPLHEALTRTGVGQVLNLNGLVKDADGETNVTATKVEIQVRDWDEGVRLIDAVCQQEGVSGP